MESAIWRLIATGLPILALFVLIVAVGWILAGVRRGALRDRTDRRRALAAAAKVGLLAAGFTYLIALFALSVGAGLSGREVGAEAYFLILLPAAVAWVLGTFVAYAGYAAFVIIRPTSVSMLGVLAGPVLFIGLAIGTTVLSFMAGNAANEAEARLAQVNLDVRSSQLEVAVDNVKITMASDGQLVEAVSLHATIHAVSDVRFQAGGKTASPQFSLVAPGGYEFPDQAAPVSDQLAAGSDTAYALEFSLPPDFDPAYLGTYPAPGVGTWILRLRAIDESGRDYLVEVELTVTP